MTPIGRQPTVLIADDDVNLRLLVRATISTEYYRVVEAADGDEAWKLLQLQRPMLALLDVNMPMRTGLELARAIRADPALAGTFIVLLTAKAQPLDISAGLAAGADRYLTKPFSPLELLRIIEQVLDRE